MEWELLELETDDAMQNAVNTYKSNIAKVQAGRANPTILDSVKMDYYGTPTPINQIAAISVPEPRQLLVKPFDQSVNKDLTAAINAAQLGLQVSDEGDKVRITFPELTTERRQELVKQFSKYTEGAKVNIRQARQVANKTIKGDEDTSDDQKDIYHDEIQKLTDKYISQIDELSKEKEKDLMTL